MMKCQTKCGAKYRFFNKVGDELIPLLDGAASKNIVPNAFFQAIDAAGISQSWNLNNFGSGSAYSYQLGCRLDVGTGSTPPTVEDTSLVSAAGSVTPASATGTSSFDNFLSYDAGTDEIVITNKRTFTFPLGAVAANISEVGLYCTTSSNSTFVLQSRSLVKDTSGTPTSVTVTVNDQLVVVVDFEWRLSRTVTGSLLLEIEGEPIAFPFTAKLNIGNSTPSYLHAMACCFGKAASSASQSGNQYRSRDTDFSFVAWNAGISSSGWDFNNSSATGLVKLESTNPAPGQLKNRFRIPLAAANYAGGIKGLMFQFSIGTPSLYGYWTFKFDTPLPKTDEYFIELDVAMSFASLT